MTQPTSIKVKQRQPRENMTMQLPDIFINQNKKLNKDDKSSTNDTSLSFPTTMLYTIDKQCDFRDNLSKLMFISAHKAGCTQSLQLIYAHVGVLQDALKVIPTHSFKSLFRYWNKNASKVPRHSKTQNNNQECATICQQQDWTCIKIIRNPLDRAVSSYVHVVKSNIWRNFKELHEVTNQSSTNRSAWEATFEEFVDALELRAIKPIATSLDNHFLPQKSSAHCDENVDYLIPLDATDIGLELVDLKTNLSLPRTKNLISSSHYVSTTTKEAVVGNRQAQGNAAESESESGNTTGAPAKMVVDASRISPIISERLDKSLVYEYDAYYLNSNVNAKVCRLYYMDFQLYAKACQQTIEKFQKLGTVEGQSSAAASTTTKQAEGEGASLLSSSLLSSLQQIQQVCENQWQRITNICGGTFRELSN